MDKIDRLLDRGVNKIYPSKEALEKILRSGKKLRLYQGFDPTGADLHIGHMTGLRKLAQFQALDHEVIFLIGDFTGMIGDPTGKYSVRKVLTKEQVLKNAKTYKQQAGKVLRFSGKNPAIVKHNSDWLGKMSAIEFLRLSNLLSYQQVVERDMFQDRIKKDQDIFLNEFFYPLLQAYDSVVMDIDMEIGGTDQMFNMMMGRKLMRKMKRKEKFVMTTPLLADNKGIKIGKSEGNVIGLTDKPNDLFGKIMSLSDDVIIKGFEYLTDAPMGEIREMEKEIEQGSNPMVFKKKLAHAIVAQLNSKTDADSAKEYFENTFQKARLPVSDIPTHVLPTNSLTTVSLLTQTDFAKSNSDARRLIKQNAVEINGEKITSDKIIVKSGDILKVGKSRFVKLKI